MIVVAAALIIAGAVLAHLHVAAQRYYPTVKVLAPEGITYIAVLDETQERQACGAANKRFIAALQEPCTHCQILWARCERVITGNEEAALLKEGPDESYRLAATGVRLAIIGPAQAAKTSCDYLARHLAKQGVSSAACIYPKAASAPM